MKTPDPIDEAGASGYDELWNQLLPIGLDPVSGGYRRFAWTEADLACREWFRSAAAERNLPVETDRNGNLWAWWDTADGKRADAIATGSHLDSVPDGGAYDGPLGVISAFAAVDVLRARGFTPSKPIAIAAFADEEGARFGIACAGSRLAAGQLTPERAAELVDADGVSLPLAMERAGVDPSRIGRDDERLKAIAAYVELHVEQGRALIDSGQAVGVADAIWPHGRWRFEFTGEANHAGTTLLEDRRDPMLTYANTVLAARKKARLAGARATFGRIEVEPNGTNAIPSRVRGWLDGRAPAEETLTALVDEIRRAATERGERDGVTVGCTAESRTPIVRFPATLRGTITSVLGRSNNTGAPAIPVLPTGAGHDAGILAAELATAMLFVRNPSGVSHSPAEHADRSDCLAGVTALADVLERLAGAGPEPRDGDSAKERSA